MDAWKIVGLVVGAVASVTAMLGALYGIVTVPILRTIKAEISGCESRLEKKMVEMEARLNQRIDTRLVHR